MHRLQREINQRWAADGLPAFGLGLGLSTGEAAAALLGSAERLEYTLVGDTVNLSQRLQQFADAGETVLSGATLRALSTPLQAIPLGARMVKGRDTPVTAFKIIQPAASAGAAAAQAAARRAAQPAAADVTTRMGG